MDFILGVCTGAFATAIGVITIMYFSMQNADNSVEKKTIYVKNEYDVTNYHVEMPEHTDYTKYRNINPNEHKKLEYYS